MLNMVLINKHCTCQASLSSTSEQRSPTAVCGGPQAAPPPPAVSPRGHALSAGPAQSAMVGCRPAAAALLLLLVLASHAVVASAASRSAGTHDGAVAAEGGGGAAARRHHPHTGGGGDTDEGAGAPFESEKLSVEPRTIGNYTTLQLREGRVRGTTTHSGREAAVSTVESAHSD
eukprot:COSAG01_NODE_23_length_37704_cov_30.005877_43_plen_174_part_00